MAAAVVLLHGSGSTRSDVLDHAAVLTRHGFGALLIAAGDVADESRAARSVQSGSPDTVQVWVVPHTGHVAAVHTHPEEWQARVVTFLDSALGLEEQAAPSH